MKRGLRTVVYDDTIPEEQSYESVMPSQAPAMDNVMPAEPGMEDPSLRQIALAEGGTPAGKKTEKITRVGKPVYETSEGEMVSEQSRTLKLGDLYYNVPSIHDGKKYTDEQLVELLNKNLISPTSVHSSLEGALDESKFRSSTLFDTEEDYGQQLSAREGSFADGGVVQREELKGGTALDKGNISVQSKRGSNVVYGLIFPGGKKQEETFYQAVRERYSNLKPKGEKYSANWFAKTFPISERQARRAIAYIRDKEKLQYREPLPTEKYLSNKRRREAIKKHGGIQTSPFQGTKKTNLSHLDDIYSQYIKGSNMGYAPRAINEKLGEADGIDFKIRALYEKRNKLLKENPKDIVKQLEDINLKGARLSGEAKGFKQFTLQDPITGKQSVIGGGKFTLDPTDQFKGMTERQIQDFILNANPNDFDAQLKIKLFQENRKASFEAAKKFPKEKIKTIIENIGCPTGTLKAANGANCYIKGAEKIQAGKLNQNEFNVLQKAVKSPAVANAIKYGGVALKGLGALFAPLMVYDTYTAYKEGKPISEALEYGLLGTNIIGGTRDELKLTPREREARGVQQQYEREQQDVSGLSSDFYVPSDLSADQAAKIYKQGQDRVAAERAAEEEQAALENVYQGDPGILDYSEYAYGGRVGLEKGSDPKDKPIIPMNPMMDEGPQDPSRRTFIQGAGGVGLAGLLLGTGLLKLGKSVGVPSKIGSMIKNTTAPSWMEALITKVMKEGTDIPIPKQPGATAEKISMKELEFKNPENGKTEIIRLKIDEAKDTIDVDYIGDNTLAGQGVNFKLSPKEKIVNSKDGKYLTSEKVKGEYQFSAHEAEPRVVNWDGDIEFDGETGVRTIIDLNSDISGLKSFVTGGKGVDKKVAKIKRETVDKIEKNPAEYIEEGFDYSYYDPSLPTE
jgi:hypothetical protein